MSEELVLIPGGYRRKSLAQLTGPGHKVRLKDKHVHKVDSTGKMVAAPV